MGDFDNKTKYNFKFVDRKENVDKLEKFMNDEKYYILKMSGVEGIGKRRLILFFLNEKLNQEEYIYVGDDINPKNNYLEALLDVIDNTRPKFFQDYIKKHGLSIVETATEGSVLSPITKTLNYLFSQKEKNNNQMSELKKIFIDLKEKGVKLLVLNNFDITNSYSRYFISDITKYLNDEKIMKVIFIVNDKAEEKIHFHALLPHHLETYISNIPHEKYFTEIFNNLTTTRQLLRDEIYDIYKYCDGNPQELVLLIEKTSQNTINANSNEVDVDVLINVLMNRETKYVFNIENGIVEIFKNRSMFLPCYILICFEVSLNKTTIYDIIKAVNSKLCFNSNPKITELKNNDYKECLNKLISLNIISQENSTNFNCWFSRFIYYDKIKSIIFNDVEWKLISQIVSQAIFDYIVDNSEVLEIYDGIKIDHLTKIKIKCMSLCEHKDILKEVQNISKDYFVASNFIKVSELYIFLKPLYLNKQINDNAFLIQMAQVFYNAGHYQDAKELLESFQITTFEYCFLKAKTYNVLLKKNQALEILDNLSELELTNEQKNVIINLKILVLIEKEDGRKRALKIFKEFYNDFMEYRIIDNLYYAVCLTNAFNFLPHKISKELMILALDYMVNCQESYERNFYIGSTYHNLGAIIARQENLYDAEIQFTNALKYLNETRAHERAYTYNNLGFIKLNEQLFDEAEANLEMALILTDSKYAEIAIKCNLLICYCEKGFFNLAKFIAIEFEDDLNKQHFNDPVIIRKLSVNLAYYNAKIGNILETEKIMTKCVGLVINTSSAYRYNQLIEYFNLNIIKISNVKLNENDESAKQLFESWCITINHD